VKTTIENIAGVPHTVVWHTMPYVLEEIVHGFISTPCGIIIYSPRMNREHHCLATALPPLPRHPAAKDAWLLYAYASHGLYPVFRFKDIGDGADELQIRGICDDGTFYTESASEGIECGGSYYHHNDGITHAVNAQGERVDVAIEEDVCQS